METKISAGGRIVIPKSIRKMFGLEVGEEVIIDVEGRRIVIKPKKIVEDPVDRLYGSIKVKPETSPKKVAREWAAKEVEKDIL